MAGNINEAAIFSRDSNLPLLADLQYLEPYMSGGLNRKMLGIILPGVYRGFDVKPGTGLNVVVSSTADGSGAACVEVNGYQITVQQFNDVIVPVSKGQTTIIALEANYGLGLVTRQVSNLGTVDAAKLVTFPQSQSLKPNQIEIARVSLSSSATSVKQTDINMETRTRRRVGPIISDAIDSFEQYQVASSNAVRLAIAAAKLESDKKIQIGSLGIGGDSIPLEDPFDWQTRIFKGGEYVYINFLKSLNRPGIDYPSGYYQINVMGLTDNSNFQTLLIRPLNYAQPLAPFLISWTGLPGARVFRTRAIVTSLGTLNDLPGVKPNDLTLLCHAGIYGQTSTPSNLSDGYPVLEPGTLNVIPAANTVQHEYITSKTRRRFTRSRLDAATWSEWTELATLDKDTFWNAGLNVGLAQKSAALQNPVYLNNATPDANKIVGGLVAKWGSNLSYAGLRRAAANADILGYSVELNGKERMRLTEGGQISLYSTTVPGFVLRSANDESQQAAIYQDMSTSSLVLDNTIDGTQVTLKGKGIQVNSTPAEASEALISGTVGKGSWTNWASRSAGLYINVLKENAASNIIKAGCPTDGESIFSVDVAYMSTGNAAVKVNVGSSSLNSQWEFAALNGNFTTPGLVVLNSSSFKGAATFNGFVYAQSNVTVGGALTVSGNSVISGALTVNGSGLFASDNIGLALQPLTANKACYIRGRKADGSQHWSLGQGADSTDTVTLRNHLTNSYIDLDTNKLTLGAANIAAAGALSVTGDFKAAAGSLTAGTAVFGYRSVYTRDNGAPYQTFRRQDVQRAPVADTEIGRVVFGYGDTGLDNYATAGLLSYMRGDALVNGSGQLTLVANNGGGATGASLSISGTGAVDITGDLRLNNSLILNKYFQTTLGIDIGYRSTTAQQQGLNFFSAGNTTLTGSLFVSGPTMSSSVMNVTASLINLNGATAVGGDFTALGNINTYGTMHTNYGIDIGYQNRVAQAQQIAFYTGGSTALTGAVSVFGSTVDNSTMTLTASSVAVTGNATFRKDLQINGNTAFLGLAAFDGPINTRWGLALGYRDTKAETQQLVFYTAGTNQVWTGLIEVAGTTLANSNMNLNSGNVNIAASGGKINLYGPVSTSSSITSQGEVVVNVNGNNLRLNNGTQSVLHRTTPSYYYILTTQAGDPLGLYNNLRPITIDLNSGLTMLGHGARIDGNLEARASATVAGTLSVSGDTALARNLVVSGSVTSIGEIITNAPNGLRLAQDNYSIFMRNDGSNFWLLLTDQGNKYGWYNNLRPFSINLADGSVNMGHTVSVGGNLYMNGGDLRFNSAGSIYMNGGDTIFNRDGNVRGAVWGGWLSNWAAPRNTAALGLNGWHRDASTGLIRQWGQAPGGADDKYYTVNLPIQFPSAFVTLNLTPGYGAAVVDKHSLSVHGAIINNAQFGYGVSDPAGDAITAGCVYWEAIGW